MIVYCQQCNTNPIEAFPLDVFVDGTFEHTMKRPLCKPCLRQADPITRGHQAVTTMYDAAHKLAGLGLF